MFAIDEVDVVDELADEEHVMAYGNERDTVPLSFVEE